MNWWTVIGIILTTAGLILTVFSIFYARSQAKKLSDLKRNQIITLWSTLARVGRSISDIVKVSDDEDFINDGTLSEKQRSIIPKVHRGLSDQYIRLAELIVQNDQSITRENIESWHQEKRPGVETEWRKKQFINLIEAGKSG